MAQDQRVWWTFIPGLGLDLEVTSLSKVSGVWTRLDMFELWSNIITVFVDSAIYHNSLMCLRLRALLRQFLLSHKFSDKELVNRNQYFIYLKLKTLKFTLYISVLMLIQIAFCKDRIL